MERVGMAMSDGDRGQEGTASTVSLFSLSRGTRIAVRRGGKGGNPHVHRAYDGFEALGMKDGDSDEERGKCSTMAIVIKTSIVGDGSTSPSHRSFVAGDSFEAVKTPSPPAPCASATKMRAAPAATRHPPQIARRSRPRPRLRRGQTTDAARPSPESVSAAPNKVSEVVICFLVPISESILRF